MNAIAILLEELRDVAERQETRSPEWYLDQAQKLASMWLDVKDDVTKYEMAYKSEVVDLIEKGDSVASAKLKVEAKSDNYKAYLYAKARDEQVNEIILLAKRRASLRDSF